MMPCESVAEQSFLTAWESKPRKCALVSQYSPGWAFPRRFDFGLTLDGLTVCVEIDGRAWHNDARSFRVDRQKDRLAVQNGSVVLRFSADEALYHGETAADEAEQLAPAFIVPRRLETAEISGTTSTISDFVKMFADSTKKTDDPKAGPFGAVPPNFSFASTTPRKRVRRSKEQILADEARASLDKSVTVAELLSEKPAQAEDIAADELSAKTALAKDVAAALQEIMGILSADSTLPPIVRTRIDVPRWWSVLVHDPNDRVMVTLQGDSDRCLAGLYLYLKDLLYECQEARLLDYNDWVQLQKDISAAEIHEKYEIDSLAETDSAGFSAARSASADTLAILHARLRCLDGRRRAQEHIADDLEESMQAIDKVRKAHAKYLA